jgi:hypothetical protein
MIRKAIRKWINQRGYDLIKLNSASLNNGLPIDFTPLDRQIINKVRPFTMTSPERIAALINSIQYLKNSRIKGSIVECGVWKGGSMMAAIFSLLDIGDLERSIYLYDTFEGMSEPSENDESFTGKPAAELLKAQDRMVSESVWCYSTLDEVKNNIQSTQYPADKIHFIQGKVEDTIPLNLPEPIALLRLDTDWYESTRHELEHLFPLIVKGGVLIIDDYGHWKGARKAVDEYFQKQGIQILLNRIDYTGRIAIKL